MPKVLILGGTGAMGIYLVPKLIELGFDVVVTSRSIRPSDNEKLTYIQGNAHNRDFIKGILIDDYDAIVDFMHYTTEEFCSNHELLLKNTNHYIFLSTYRVFAESNVPINEESPRLLDVSTDAEYLNTDEYALTKARQENILNESQYKNWTIVRPTITYSKARFQLGTLEAGTVIFRALCNLPVILPQEMMQKHTTMTWAGDAARMITCLILNQAAFGESYNVCTNEHRSWAEVASYYEKLINLQVIPTNIDIYTGAIGGKYQILYDRMYNRIMDNTKIIEITGLKNESLTSIYDGLAMELADWPDKFKFIDINYVVNAKLDRITHSYIPLRQANLKERLKYYSSYTGVYDFMKRIPVAVLIYKTLKRKLVKNKTLQ